ncbi:MAG: BolA family transcriptional regulator [Beijerinckiaceae bacterium]|nr:BolA family transcriptional regulator [Beijerinckiaceae bacterium]
MSRQERIQTLLSSLEPISLEVIDESHQHHGHSGWREGGETHYRVIIRAKAFDGLSRVERHRRVNALLAPEFETGLHALAVVARSSAEP